MLYEPNEEYSLKAEFFQERNRLKIMRLLENFVIQNRSYRRFDSTVSIKEEELIYLIDQARKVASAKNAQPLKYRYCLCEQEKNDIFPLLSWAALLKDWRGPKADERPAAYIVMSGTTTLSFIIRYHVTTYMVFTNIHNFFIPSCFVYIHLIK